MKAAEVSLFSFIFTYCIHTDTHRFLFLGKVMMVPILDLSQNRFTTSMKAIQQRYSCAGSSDVRMTTEATIHAQIALQMHAPFARYWCTLVPCYPEGVTVNSLRWEQHRRVLQTQHMVYQSGNGG